MDKNFLYEFYNKIKKLQLRDFNNFSLSLNSINSNTIIIFVYAPKDNENY